MIEWLVEWINLDNEMGLDALLLAKIRLFTEDCKIHATFYSKMNSSELYTLHPPPQVTRVEEALNLVEVVFQDLQTAHSYTRAAVGLHAGLGRPAPHRMP